MPSSDPLAVAEIAQNLSPPHEAFSSGFFYGLISDHPPRVPVMSLLLLLRVYLGVVETRKR
jgi:hypothetical protein